MKRRPLYILKFDMDVSWYQNYSDAYFTYNYPEDVHCNVWEYFAKINHVQTDDSSLIFEYEEDMINFLLRWS